MDLGGGTGNFTQALAEAAQVRRRVLCVDAFAEMLEKARGHGAESALPWQLWVLLLSFSPHATILYKRWMVLAN